MLFAGVAWRKRTDSGGTPLVLCHVAIAVGSLAYARDVLATTLAVQILWARVAGRTVSVTVTVGETTDGFSVADDGPGIGPANRDAVFDNGFTTAGDGTGYGLAIVETIAEAHR